MTDKKMFEHGQYELKKDLRRRCGDDLHLCRYVLKDFHRWIALSDAYVENYGLYRKVASQTMEGMRIRDGGLYVLFFVLLSIFSFFFLDSLVFQFVLVLSIILIAHRITKDLVESPKILEISRRRYELSLELKKINSDIEPDRMAAEYIHHSNKDNYNNRYASSIVVNKYNLPD